MTVYCKCLYVNIIYNCAVPKVTRNRHFGSVRALFGAVQVSARAIFGTVQGCEGHMWIVSRERESDIWSGSGVRKEVDGRSLSGWVRT